MALQPDLEQFPVGRGVGVQRGQPSTSGPSISASAGMMILSSVPITQCPSLPIMDIIRSSRGSATAPQGRIAAQLKVGATPDTGDLLAAIA